MIEPGMALIQKNASPPDDVHIPLQQLADEVRDLRKVVEDVLRAIGPVAQDVKAARENLESRASLGRPKGSAA